MKNLRVFAKRKDSDEKLKGTGINIIGDTAILYNQYASYEVEPETVLLRADNHTMEEYNNPTTDSKLAFQLHEKIVQTIIDFMVETYPQHMLAPMALYIKAFVYESNNDIPSAKETYRVFLEKYPNDPLVEDVKASLRNAGIPLEELVRQFEEE